MVILILVQYYFISETFKTKQQQFDSKYSSLAKLGLFEFENRYIDQFEDSIFYLLDDLSYFALHDAGFSDDLLKDSLSNFLYSNFYYEINSNPTKDIFLQEYFKNAAEDTVFNTEYHINEIELLSFGKSVPIYSDSSQTSKNNIPEGYKINTYTVERNYYRIKYDFYIAFGHRTEKISREMILTKVLSLSTLLIVFTVFFLTLRNLLIQKRLSDIKTDFINNMTHELKTPLSTISVATSSLAMKEKTLPADRIIEISEIIKKQNKHLSLLIDRILDISIWEKDKIRIKKKPVKIFDFIHGIIEDFITTYPAINITVNREIKNEEEYIQIDEVHMTTVMNNLLSNAIKYGTKPTEIEISLVLDQTVKIKIKDNGPGIPKDEQKYIFDKFFRGNDSKEKVIRGLGLGLYYVKQIVEAHDGRIFLARSEPTGSLFVIEIPY